MSWTIWNFLDRVVASLESKQGRLERAQKLFNVTGRVRHEDIVGLTF
jgi:hypothetical protein